MRTYPKGCRFTTIVNGEVKATVKVSTPTSIGSLASPRRETTWVVVLPRGKNTWYLFVRHWSETPRLIRSSTEPESLIAQAVLAGNHG